MLQPVYAYQPPPKTFSKSIFLAGPTPRSNDVESWRPQALKDLEALGYDGVVFIPEPEDGKWSKDYLEQVNWEEDCLEMADCIVFWVPRELNTMPAFTTNNEWGVWQNSGKVVFGSPDDAVKVRYQRHYAQKLSVPLSNTLRDTMQNAIDLIGDGAKRTAGEQTVPSYIWNTPHFQQWYQALIKAGNRLDGARVQWTFRVGPKKDMVFLWALHVDVYIAAEDRNKVNEVVIARPDISTIVMYKPGKTMADTDIVLVKEFRSPGCTSADGMVWEVPGGSTFKDGVTPLALAAEECHEETGLEVSADRIQQHESRQMVGTLSAHHAHLFSVELTEDELDELRAMRGVAHGEAGTSERTYVEVCKLGDITEQRQVDWSMLGMIYAVISRNQQT